MTIMYFVDTPFDLSSSELNKLLATSKNKTFRDGTIVRAGATIVRFEWLFVVLSSNGKRVTVSHTEFQNIITTALSRK